MKKGNHHRKFVSLLRVLPAHLVIKIQLVVAYDEDWVRFLVIQCEELTYTAKTRIQLTV